MANDRARRIVQAPAPSKARKTLVLSADAIRRLEVAAAFEGLDESEIVESLINERLAVYVVQVRGSRFVRQEDRPSVAGEVA